MRIFLPLLASILLGSSLAAPTFAQTPGNPPSGSTERVAFVLKNNLGYHRMFRVEGPGLAYGFSMNRQEKQPHNWPVGSQLYFSRDGETRGDLILIIKAEDAGRTLRTGTPEVTGGSPGATAGGSEITVRLRNNSLGFRKIALISYQPGENGNSTSIFTLAPYAVSQRKFPVGTKLYLANEAQVGTVMSGNRIDNDKPFLVVKAADARQTFNLFSND